MRRFWLFVNTEKPRTEAVAKEIRRHLSALGAEAVTIREDICGRAPPRAGHERVRTETGSHP